MRMLAWEPRLVWGAEDWGSWGEGMTSSSLGALSSATCGARRWTYPIGAGTPGLESQRRRC